MKKATLAAAVLTLGLGAFTLPASATVYDTGHYAHTALEPSRYAPEGLPKDVIGSADEGDILAMRDQLFDVKDSKHMQW